jgi:hypothetical protein
MRQADISLSSYAPGSSISPEPLQLRRLRGAWLLLSALAAFALLMTVAGPGLTHHYAELTPAHSHVFLGDHTIHGHGASGTAHHNGEIPEVVSTSDGTGASAGAVSLLMAPPLERGLVEPSGLWHSVPDRTVAYSSPELEPPDRPPIAS